MESPKRVASFAESSPMRYIDRRTPLSFQSNADSVAPSPFAQSTDSLYNDNNIGVYDPKHGDLNLDVIDEDLAEHDKMIQKALDEAKLSTKEHLISIKKRLIEEKQRALYNAEQEYLVKFSLHQDEVNELKSQITEIESKHQTIIAHSDSNLDNVSALFIRHHQRYKSRFSLIRILHAWSKEARANKSLKKLEKNSVFFSKKTSMCRTLSTLRANYLMRKTAKLQAEAKFKFDSVTNEMIHSYEAQLSSLRSDLSEAYAVGEREARKRGQLEEDLRRMFLKNMSVMNMEALNLFQTSHSDGDLPGSAAAGPPSTPATAANAVGAAMTSAFNGNNHNNHSNNNTNAAYADDHSEYLPTPPPLPAMAVSAQKERGPTVPPPVGPYIQYPPLSTPVPSVYQDGLQYMVQQQLQSQQMQVHPGHPSDHHHHNGGQMQHHSQFKMTVQQESTTTTTTTDEDAVPRPPYLYHGTTPVGNGNNASNGGHNESTGGTSFQHLIDAYRNNISSSNKLARNINTPLSGASPPTAGSQSRGGSSNGRDARDRDNSSVRSSQSTRRNSTNTNNTSNSSSAHSTPMRPVPRSSASAAIMSGYKSPYSATPSKPTTTATGTGTGTPAGRIAGVAATPRSAGPSGVNGGNGGTTLFRNNVSGSGGK